MPQQPALVVFSHLRWNFVFQRPQHLLSRLAKRRRVLFIEEPLESATGEAHWEIDAPEPSVKVCRPRTLSSAPGFHAGQLPGLATMVDDLLRAEGVDKYVLWFYSPMAAPLAQSLRGEATIYDCMDELSAFLHAPPELLLREIELLQRADVVFTGGPSLYRAKKDRHPNVFCFPSSVDAKHFGQARSEAGDASEQAALPHPRLGFFGVIDERFDIDLLASLAEARPGWQFCMVGPVVKIDPTTLPRHANIHYFGQRTYADLPSFLAGWDVCLLPFARNEATRFISPTKTLEYMAAERPIVSTPIADVAEPYGDIVYLGATPDSFLAACERALSASADERAARTTKMRAVLARTSWDKTVVAMEAIIQEAIRKNRAVRSRKNRLAASASTPALSAGAGRSGEAFGHRRAQAKSSTPPVVIVGAGPTGLSAAYHLGKDALLLEQNSQVGGWCRSIQSKGFTFDYAGHIMFSNDPYVHELYRLLLKDNVHWQDREAWIWSKSVYTRYPFQGALHGLPADVIKECLLGAIEARFGPLSSTGAPPQLNGHANGSALKDKPAKGALANGKNGRNGTGRHCDHGDIKDCCADGIMESTARLLQRNGTPASASTEPKNFEEFIYKVWGAGIAKHFAIPYNRKLWAVPLSEMETSWLGGRVPMPDIGEMIDGALNPVPKPMGPNARFGYPLRGGFQALMDAFVPLLEGPTRLQTRVSKVSARARIITLDDGTEVPFEYLISTMPLPVLIRALGEEVPDEVRAAAAGLRHVSVRCVHIGVGREKLTEKHWIYYPEDTVFHRIFVQGNASPHCNPPGGFGLTCEITYSEHKPLPCDGPALIERCIRDCQNVGFFKKADPIVTALQCDLPHAYVVYDHARPQNVRTIRAWLAQQNILLAGRYSEWEYYNSDHAFLAGKKAADRVRELRGQTTKAAITA